MAGVCLEARAMARAMQIDRLSNLPNNILCCNILSRLPLIDAIRTSILSTTWQFLWTQIPNLHFCEDFFDSMAEILKENPHMRKELRRLRVRAFLAIRRTSSPNIVMETMAGIRRTVRSVILKDIIDKILLKHSAPLERFQLDICEEKIGFLFAGKVKQWIQCAAQKGVKWMTLSTQGWRGTKLDLPSSVFACRLLTHLELYAIVFTQIPTGFGGFVFLRKCSLYRIWNLTDEKFENIIALCPLLQKLVVGNCQELINLNVQAPNLNYLNVLFCGRVESLTAHSSQLVELKVKYCEKFSVLQINSSVCIQHLHASEVLPPHKLSSVKSLKKLSLATFLQSPRQTLILQGSFPDLEELKLTAVFIQPHFPCQVRGPSLMATGRGSIEVVESDFNFPNLKKAYVDISPGEDRKQVDVLAFLLRNAPSLKLLTLSLPHCPQNIHNQEFINQVRDLNKVSLEAELRILDNEQELDAICAEMSFSESEDG